MPQETWTQVDRYLEDLLVGRDPVLEAALRESEEAGLPAIHVSATQGKFLQILVQAQACRSVLEIGTLGGYSTIWLARGLAQGGCLVTLESEPAHAAVALRNFERAGLSDRIEVRIGRAEDSLPRLAKEGRGPFDLVFIDADKEGYPGYFEWALRLSRPGTLIVADNIIRQGAVIENEHSDPRVRGVRLMMEIASKEPRVSATALQTVGSKGYDGLLLARVVAGSRA